MRRPLPPGREARRGDQETQPCDARADGGCRRGVDGRDVDRDAAVVARVGRGDPAGGEGGLVGRWGAVARGPWSTRGAASVASSMVAGTEPGSIPRAARVASSCAADVWMPRAA